MRRTTIFRSKLLPAFAALVLIQGVARAQDSTQVAQGRTHVVQPGETLWSLAEQYLGDPLLWPAIYQLNTLVVEDPHWIFPGEELRLVPLDSSMVTPGAQVVAPVAEVPADTSAAAPPVAVAPADSMQAVERPVAPAVSAAELPPPPPPPGVGAATVFTPPKQVAAAGVSGTGGNRGLRALSRSDFYAAGFLTENDRLPWADVVAAIGKPAAGLANIASARIFESVEIRTPLAATYQVGDTLLVAQLAREIPRWGRVVVPAGLARVRESAGRRVVADVVVQYARVVSGDVAMPIEPFRDPGSVFPTPIENGMSATIIDVRDLHPLPGERNIVFVDRGREDGLTPGDVFEVLRPNPPEASPDAPMQQVAVLQVVHVRQRSASAALIQISGLGVKAGAPVRLIRKMPS
ncbi:MAG: LysM peptidoglycan-binding domain-containing protein [Gemmatimonadetes bacterium]|nr:LysM peptidoglycan-binding domain-containing protein [Gemmatimonadota bacterium]